MASYSTSAESYSYGRWEYEDWENYLRPWRKVSIADARRASVSWSKRLDAEEMLDQLIHEGQLEAANCALGRSAQAADLKAKPQKGPLYTQYPSYPAARACIGHSALAEFAAHVKDGAPPPTDPATLGAATAHLDPAALARTAQHVNEAVGIRLGLDHLLHYRKLPPVESFRLFTCAMIDPQFPRLRDVICAAVNLGDHLGGWLSRPAVRQRLHPLTVRIFEALAPTCAAYVRGLENCSPADLPQRGEALKRAILRELLPFLPRPAPQTNTTGSAPSQGTPAQVPVANAGIPPASLTQPLRGLDEVGPPFLDPPTVPFALLGSSTSATGTLPPQTDPGVAALQQALQALGQSVTAATQDEAWGGPRCDVVSRAITSSLFKAGVMEDKLATEKKRVRLLGTAREELIAEEILPRARDPQVVERLRRGATPIEKKLRRFKWFGNRRELAVERHYSAGSLDPHRLHRIGTSRLLYRRWRERVTTDFRGEPMVALAMDGSSSNTVHTSFAGQIVTAAFLQIARFARIQVLAAEYSSGQSGPLVRWLYHPRKTAHTRSDNALEVIASLPLGGQGCNHDVASISYIVREALSLVAPGQFVYVVNITDGQFNSPMPEVKAMIQALRDMPRVVHTVVVLGDHKVELPEAHYVVCIPANELQNALAIADRIATHVCSLVRNLRTQGKRGHVSQRPRRRVPAA